MDETADGRHDSHTDNKNTTATVDDADVNRDHGKMGNGEENRYGKQICTWQALHANDKTNRLEWTTP